VDVSDLIAAFGMRLATPLPTRLVTTGPVLECCAAEVDLPAHLPALTHYERDSGPFLTCGMVSMRNPQNGFVERSLCRMQVRGRDGLGLSFLTAPFFDLLPLLTERAMGGSPPSVAVVLGLEPITLLSATLAPTAGVDKLALAGSVRGEPVEVVRAPFSELEVPARAEYLFEGSFEVPGEYDGPMGESSGYYQSNGVTPTLRVHRVGHRADPVYQALLPTGPETDTLLGLVIEAALAPGVRARFPFVRQVAFAPGSFGASLVVSVARAEPSEVRSLLEHLLEVNRTKKVVVVADDVDPADLAAVEWSIVTRSQPDRDAVVRSGLPGHPIDPTCLPERITSRIGIDATGFGHYQCEGPVTFPPEAVARARDVLALHRPEGEPAP
jgi:2,5-furandicarboxylate decarboxylase 1